MSSEVTVDQEASKIENAIEKHGINELQDNKTKEMMLSLMSSKLKVGPIEKNDTSFPIKISSGMSFDTILKYLASFLTIVFMALMIYSILNRDVMDSNQPNLNKEEIKVGFAPDRDVLIVGSFEFKRGNLIKVDNDQFSGKQEILQAHKDLIMSFVWQQQKLNKPALDKINAYTKQNFLLEGPPGTGKTIFVRRVLTLIDIELKIKYLKSGGNGSEEDLALLKEWEIATEYEKAAIIEKQRSRVIYCEVAPSSINNMYVGQSEKNVATLFEAANILSREKDVCVFLFFDEGEVFFEERSGAGKSGNASAGSVKSELLQRIGVMPKNEYHKVFVYCATNLPKAFDDAFKRRFGRHDNFGFPSTDERKALIRQVFADFEYISDDIIDTIAALTVGKSHDYITRQMKEYYTTNKEGWMINGFKLREFVDHLSRNRLNPTMV